MTAPTLWSCALRSELAARSEVIRTGLQGALTESLLLLGLNGDGLVAMSTADSVDADSWAEHHFDGQAVGLNQEAALRALTLLAPEHRVSDAAWWNALLELDDDQLTAFAGWVVRGTFQAEPTAALGADQFATWMTGAAVEPADAVEQLLASALTAGLSIAEPEVRQAVLDLSNGSGTGWTPSARRTTHVALSPGLLHRLTSGPESRPGLFDDVLQIFASRSGIPGPTIQTRPDNDLPESSFAFRTGALREVPFRALGPGEWIALTHDSGTDPMRQTGSTVDPITGALAPRIMAVAAGEDPPIDAGMHVAAALLQHLYVSASLFVDSRLVSDLLDAAAVSSPRLVDRVRAEVGISTLTSICRSLLRQRLGIPWREAFLHRILDASLAGDDPMAPSVLASARRAAIPFGVDMIAWGNVRALPAVVLEIADDWSSSTPSLIVTAPDQLDNVRATIVPGNPRHEIISSDILPPGQRLLPLSYR